MHHWGDEDVDWNGIESAIGLIMGYLRLYRVPVRDYKEKYGTVRIYCSIGWHSFLCITHPGYVHYGPYPSWLKVLDIYYGSNILYWTGLMWLSQRVHMWAYRRAYRKAVEAFPHLRREILGCADYSELLKGI